ncbi:hypothetical protein [Streptomyces cyaneus]|uniref:hypothetical protein n=1 Tax=Streptomyces cyaneus TaxID=1904 RepID=UPI000FF8ADDA|nr:hypothetical protein [Streptomyces cyaneus]
MTTATRVELRIRRLVWEGAGPPSPAALCAAVEAELAVLLGDSPTVAADAPDPAVPADCALTAHARRIARAVHDLLRAGQPPDPQRCSRHLVQHPAPDAAPATPTSGPRPKAGALIP